MLSFPYIRKLLTKTLREAENTAIDEGVDTTTPEFKNILQRIRDEMLAKISVDVSDYEDYLQTLKDIGIAKSQAKRAELNQQLLDMETRLEQKLSSITYNSLPDKPSLMTPNDVSAIVNNAISKIPKIQPLIKIERPITQVTETIQYNDQPLKDTLKDIKRQVDNIKIPEMPLPIDIGALKEEFHNEFQENFKKNINMMGMSDFRMLGMGLQDQIDALKKHDTGDVTSVFGRTGAVVATSGDYNTGQLTVSTDKNFVTDAQQTVIQNISGTNTGDQNLSAYALIASTPTITDKQSLTGKVADITDTAFVGNTAGLYRVSYYLLDTTADLAAGAVTLNIKYTDTSGARTVSSSPVVLTATTAFTTGTIICQLASGNITYGVTHSGIFNNAVYALYITLERLI